MEYRTGDIIKTSTNAYPFIYHYGIIVIVNNEIKVVHNSPDEKNDYGGNILVYDLNKFYSTRKLVHIQRTNISKKRILEIADRYKSRPFNLLTFNCEHFIFEIRDGTPSSPQVRYWLYNLVGFIIIISMIRQNKLTVKNAFFTVLRKI